MAREAIYRYEKDDMDEGRRARVLARISQLSVTAGAETIGVALGAVAGFAIVHQLPKEAYGQYSFIVVCLTFLIGLSDIGLSHCYLPLVSARAADTTWVIAACRRVYQLRWRFFLPAAILVVGYWAHATLQHAWTGLDFLLASLIAVAAVMATIREQAMRSLLIVLRHVGTVNRMTLSSSLARLILVLLVLVALPGHYTLSGLLVATALGSVIAIAQLVRVDAVKQFAAARLEGSEKTSVDARISQILKPLLIPMAFYQLQGVITIFLVSLFGVTNSIAEVGALTRPTLILAVIDRVMSVLLYPAIARAGSGRPLHLLVMRSQMLYFLLMICLLISSIALPDLWILLIGSQYLAQKNLLWMVFLSAIMMYSAGFAFTTLTSRGKTSGQYLLIPLVLAVQLGFVLNFGAATTEEALAFSIVTSATFFIFQYTLLAAGYVRSHWKASAA